MDPDRSTTRIKQNDQNSVRTIKIRENDQNSAERSGSTRTQSLTALAAKLHERECVMEQPAKPDMPPPGRRIPEMPPPDPIDRPPPDIKPVPPPDIPPPAPPVIEPPSWPERADA